MIEASNPGADALALLPTLLLNVTHQGHNKTLKQAIPAAGVLLGRDSPIFGEQSRDLRMSLSHAEVRRQGERVLLRDLQSAGGTRVNGLRIFGERELAPGDVLRLGDTLLVYARALTSPSTEGHALIGGSAAMATVRRSIDAVGARMHSVVVSGETGTGKEVVARALHQRSGRTGPFLAVNCGCFTEGLLASDLFGHVRGAFTGAISEEPGLFRAANQGTLVLDEVTDMPLALQSKLLRVLETRAVRPVGGAREIPTDVRVIATANGALIERVQARKFRADLYARLAQWTIHLPPLRERREDIPELTFHLLARCDGLGRHLTPDLAEALLLHDWPLNVRGLLNVLSIAVISSPGDGPLQLCAEVLLALAASRSLAAGNSAAVVLAVNLDEAALTELMERFRGRVSAAARHIGVGRPKLYRMLWQHGLEPRRFRTV